MLPPRTRNRVPILIALALLSGACASDTDPVGSGSPDAPTEVLAAAEGHTVTVHRTATCSCCGDYEAYLESVGFTVEPRIHEDLTDVKHGFGIPEDEGSCHTNEVAGYAAEGHVPAEALLEMIEQAPEVDGITLAGMPAGSPGMPGEQQGPLVVRSFVDGEVVGEFGRY